MTVRYVEEVIVAGHHWDMRMLIGVNITFGDFSIRCAEQVDDDLDALLPAVRSRQDEDASDFELVFVRMVNVEPFHGCFFGDLNVFWGARRGEWCRFGEEGKILRNCDVPFHVW